ncbi:hypothetical protein OIU84_012408 [Salix udensis]|uniref:Uncharacterized protein n=1 Tax=Salix udensis TaxID=889485 RepID=A0AAD6JFJ2_9ROSI|nr:hypothetical protein OIU84_012408 [Salix udensis]
MFMEAEAAATACLSLPPIVLFDSQGREPSPEAERLCGFIWVITREGEGVFLVILYANYLGQDIRRRQGPCAWIYRKMKMDRESKWGLVISYSSLLWMTDQLSS